MSTTLSVHGRHMEIQRLNQEILTSRDTFGDFISKTKSKKVMRVVFQNINGLGTNEKYDKREYL